MPVYPGGPTRKETAYMRCDVTARWVEKCLGRGSSLIMKLEQFLDSELVQMCGVGISPFVKNVGVVKEPDESFDYFRCSEYYVEWRKEDAGNLSSKRAAG